MAKKILDNPEYQNIILEKIELSGFNKNVWIGICSERTFYEYIEDNLQFSQAVTRAKENWRKTVWKERPDLRRLAIEGLEKNLRDYNQIIVKEIYDILPPVVPTEKPTRVLVKQIISKWTKPPAKWAIEAVLGMNIDLEDEEELETSDFHYTIITKDNYKKFAEN